MITPQHLFDGALLATGTALSVSINPSVQAAIAGAAVSGVFIVLAKGLELYIKGWRDRRAQRDAERIAELEQDLQSTRSAWQHAVDSYQNKQ